MEIGGKRRKAKSFEIKVLPNKKYLSRIRKFVDEVVQEQDILSQEKIDDLQLCISETLVNSISAHKKINCKKLISIKIFLFKDHIKVEIKDKGKGFDSKSVFPKIKKEKLGEQDLTEKGMGLKLIEELTDVCDIKSTSRGTSTRLSIFIK